MIVPTGMSLRPQDKRALAIGAAALALMLGYSRILRPSLDGLSRDEQSFSEQKALLRREHALLALAPRLPAEKREVSRVLASEAPRLFPGDSVAATSALAAHVSEFAAVTAVRLSSLQGRVPGTENGLTRVVVDVRGEGSWTQVLSFVRLLEASAQLIDIPTLRLERGPRGGPLGGETVLLTATIAGYARGMQ